MYVEEFAALTNAAKGKVNFLKKNPLGYFVASMLAGMFVGIGIVLIFTVGGMLSGQPYAKIAMGLAFGIALSLVVMAGSELFTGNNLVMTGGAMSGAIKWSEAIKLWVVCYLGNWVGSVLIAVLFAYSGFASDEVGAFFAAGAAGKMGLPAMALFLKGVLCNILVCLAVWCGFRCKSDSGKLIMIFWCLFAFITCGFEHSVANMTLLTIGMLKPFGQAVSMSGYLYNLSLVTIGNMVGGILFVAIPYFLIARQKEV